MNRAPLVGGVLLIASALGGCASWSTVGGSASPATTELAPYTPGPAVQEHLDDQASRPTSTTPPVPEVVTNSRGNIESQLGVSEGFTYNSNGAAVDFTVNGITVDVACTEEYSSDPENGHLIAVDITFKTGSTLQDYTSVSSYDFRIVGSDGTTRTELTSVATYGCLPDSALLTSSQMGPGQTFTGVVLLDSPVASGSLIYAPGGLGNGSGWEWTF